MLKTIQFFQVQSAAMGALKEELMDISQMLKQVTCERDALERTVNRVQVIILISPTQKKRGKHI